VTRTAPARGGVRESAVESREPTRNLSPDHESAGGTRIARGFGRIAPSYDILARAVFGNALRKSQCCFLGRIPADADILVLGGGSGWFLEQLLAVTNCRSVCYVDVSAVMQRRARERISRHRPHDLARVSFVTGGPESIPTDARFDLLCTHCFLDLFTDETLRAVSLHLTEHLRADALWYFSDFRAADGFPMSALSRLLLGAMYRFFRMICGVEARRLPRFDEAFRATGFAPTAEARFHGGMVQALLLSSAAVRDQTRSKTRGAPATQVGDGAS
jgi:SAM-dependent methyltransferase